MSRYVGRFAPSPSGALHDGSLIAALASWLDARAHDGRWCLRIEDIDPPREVPGAADAIIATLDLHGLHHDGPITWQSTRTAAYQEALDRLDAIGLVYPCGCSRSEVAAMATAHTGDGEPIYPGTCRNGLPPGRIARSWRMRMPDTTIEFVDRRLGLRSENPARDTGDIVLKRADGVWSYQLAVVVDDLAIGVTDVVRGADLLGSTARQIAIIRALGAIEPRYLHLALLLDADGLKLGKQTGAPPLDPDRVDESLISAARQLGLDIDITAGGQALLEAAVAAWAQVLRGPPSKAPTLPA